MTLISTSWARASVSLLAFAALSAACSAVDLGSDGTGEQPIVLGDGGTGSGCGTRGAPACAQGLTCILPESAQCGAADMPGSCQALPKNCLAQYAPVCGCDGVTYGNECDANGAGVSVKFKGQCAVTTNDGGANADSGARGVDGDACGSRDLALCGTGLACIFDIAANCGANDMPGTCRVPPQFCTQNIEFACGCDGKTYNNPCKAIGVGVSVKRLGHC